MRYTVVMSFQGEKPANIWPDADWVDVSGSLLNSWVIYDVTHGNAKYCRVNGIVHLYFMVKSGTNWTPVYTLPAGFRPSKRLICNGAMGEPNTHTWHEIWEDGTIRMHRNDTWGALAISYPAEQ